MIDPLVVAIITHALANTWEPVLHDSTRKFRELLAEAADGRCAVGGHIYIRSRDFLIERIDRAVRESFREIREILLHDKVQPREGRSDQIYEIVRKKAESREMILGFVRHCSENDSFAYLRDPEIDANEEKIILERIRPSLRFLKVEADKFDSCLRKEALPKGQIVMSIVAMDGSHVGAVQTDGGSTTFVQQQIGAFDFSALRNVLKEIKERVSGGFAALPPCIPQAELIQVLDDAVSESEREQPNKLKLAGYLASIGRAAGSINEVGDLYSKLKPLASPFGITLT